MLQVTENDVNRIEEATRGQAKSTRWHDERLYRVTASHFGAIGHMTNKRDTDKLCDAIYGQKPLKTPAVLHGKEYEKRAVELFSQKTHERVQPCGLFVSLDQPFLAASPDGVTDSSALLEVKCPFAGRYEKIVPGEHFPFLCNTDANELTLKKSHVYFDQVQGQLHITGKKKCFFVIYTFEDLQYFVVDYDHEYCTISLFPKLVLFYEKFYRPYLVSKIV